MKAALLTALTARAGLSGVTVSYGAPTQGPREFIALSDISGTQEFAMLGHLRKDETYTLSVYCSVLREGNMQHGNFFAQALWKAESVSRVPGVNQAVSPFLGDHFGNLYRSGHQRLLRSGESLEMPHEVSGGGPSGS